MPETTYWESPALVAQLVPGARVRIRISAECADRCSRCGEGRHDDMQSGDVGTITAVRDDPGDLWHCLTNKPWHGVCEGVFPRAGHRFAVRIDRFDDPRAREGRGGWFAAVELTPIVPRATEGA